MIEAYNLLDKILFKNLIEKNNTIINERKFNEKLLYILNDLYPYREWDGFDLTLPKNRDMYELLVKEYILRLEIILNKKIKLTKLPGVDYEYSQNCIKIEVIKEK